MDDGVASWGHDEGLLCNDLLMKILCRLPPVSLVRSKCVSKKWNRLISDVCVPRVSPLPLSGVFMSRFHIWFGEFNVDCFFEFAALDPAGRDKGLKVPPHGGNSPADLDHLLLDCCNGLCLYRKSQSLHLYYLSNATTNQCVVLPPQSRSWTARLSCAVLAYDPRESPDYRVVLFAYRSNLCRGIANVFFSKTGKWVECVVQYGSYNLPLPKMHPVDRCIYFKGAVYRQSNTLHLLRYDLENLEKHKMVNFTATELPGFGRRPRPFRDHELGCLGLSAGRLCYTTRTENSILIWMLPNGDSDCEWIVMHQISIPQLLTHPLRSHLVPAQLESEIHQFLPNNPSPVFNLLCLDPVSDGVILQSGDLLLRYGLDTHDLEVVLDLDAVVPQVDIPPARGSIPPCKVFPFSRSLVPLKDIRTPR